MVRAVGEVAGQYILLTNRKKTTGSYSQQRCQGRSNPVEPVTLPEPGDQGRPKASCRIQAGTRNRSLKPNHHPDQNPYHEWCPTHETMATHKQENGEYEHEG